MLKNSRLVLVISVLLLLQLSCNTLSAPVRSIKPSNIFIEISAIPERLAKGEAGRFAIKVAPGNLCFGVINYTRITDDKVEVIDLPNLRANGDGTCVWSWITPPDAKSGVANFKAAVEQDGRHGSISPQTFCIDVCPWDQP